MLKGSKVIKSKAPNLEGLLQTPSEVLYLHLATLTIKGCDLLLDHDSYKTEYKAPNLEERAPRKLEAPPIEYEAPKQERTR